MSARVYDECIKRLQKAGAAHPAGRVYHSCFGTNDSVNVFDVWTSQAAFEKFGETLMPILQALGTDPGQPIVMEVHNVIVPPVKKSSVRRAAPKRGAKPAKSRSKSRGRGRGRR
jgi:hypothetical protein